MSIYPDALRAQEHDSPMILTRRHLVEMAGVALVGTALCAVPGVAAAAGSASPRFPAVPMGAVHPESIAGVGLGSISGGMKPVFVARPGSIDPVEHSVADTLFWGEQMMEHAMFFVMLMPGPELAAARSQAERHWREDPRLLRAYAWLTALWGGVFVVRAVVQGVIYQFSEDDVTALGTVSLVLGLPVTAAEILLTLWVVSRLHRHRALAPVEPPGPGEAEAPPTGKSRQDPAA